MRAPQLVPVLSLLAACTEVQTYGAAAIEQRRVMNDLQARATMAATCDISLGAYFRELSPMEQRYAGLVCGGMFPGDVRAAPAGHRRARPRRCASAGGWWSAACPARRSRACAARSGARPGPPPGSARGRGSAGARSAGRGPRTARLISGRTVMPRPFATIWMIVDRLEAPKLEHGAAVDRLAVAERLVAQAMALLEQEQALLGQQPGGAVGPMRPAGARPARPGRTGRQTDAWSQARPCRAAGRVPARQGRHAEVRRR